MTVPTPASVADLAMTVPTLFAAALGIWFAGTTAILLSATRLTRRITKFRLFSAMASDPHGLRSGCPTESEQHSVIARQTSGDPAGHWDPAAGLQITRTLLRIAAFAFGLGVTLPTLAQTIERLLTQHHRSVHPAR